MDVIEEVQKQVLKETVHLNFIWDKFYSAMTHFYGC